MNKLKGIVFTAIIFTWVLIESNLAYAQSDTIYMSVYKGYIANRYQILLLENGKWIKEDYAAFKGQIWLTHRFELPDTVKISGETYKEQKGKYIDVYKQFAICDSAVNQIRNHGFYNKVDGEVDSIARSRIGYNNTAFNAFSNQKAGELMRSSTFFRADCYDEFRIKAELVKQEELAFIDSVYTAKAKRATLASSSPEMIDLAFIYTFLNTFDETEPDLRTLERIMVHQPEMLLSAVNRIYPETSYLFILKLGDFPKDLDLTAAKTALEETKQRNPLKRKVIRKMKNKK